jgi:CP family cyanate transporter-like MFS transporter
VTTIAVPLAPLWRGRVLALVGIVLVAVNLRTAVAAISPIITQIRVDIPIDSIAFGVLGSVPPITFAVSAIVTPMLSRRIGLERLMIVAIIAMVAGHVIRAVAPGFAVLLVGTVVTIAGAGIGNVLLPPLVKRYFPDRIGLLTSIYALLIAVSGAVPAIVSTPVADSSGWRFSLALWGFFAVAAAIPWCGLVLAHRRARGVERAGDESPELPEPDPQLLGRIWHSKVAWALAITFGSSSFGVYAVFAWLPQLLVQTAGVTPTAAGALLALTSIIGAPSAILLPLLTVRVRRVSILVWVGVGCYAVAYLGLLFFPVNATVVWVIFAGAGPLIFPVCLALINLRTRTQRGSVALSGFAQSIGYLLASLGPLSVGIVHTLSGGWTAPLLLLLAVALIGSLTAPILSRPVFVEDELESRHRRRQSADSR